MNWAQLSKIKEIKKNYNPLVLYNGQKKYNVLSYPKLYKIQREIAKILKKYLYKMRHLIENAFLSWSFSTQILFL